MSRIYRKYLRWDGPKSVSFILPRPFTYCTVLYTNVRLRIYAQNELLVGIVEPGSHAVLSAEDAFETCRVEAAHVARTFNEFEETPTPRPDRGETLLYFSDAPIDSYISSSRVSRWLTDYYPLPNTVALGESPRIFEPDLPLQAALGYMYGMTLEDEKTFIYPLRPGIKSTMDDAETLATGLYAYEDGWERLQSVNGKLRVLADLQTAPTLDVNVSNSRLDVQVVNLHNSPLDVNVVNNSPLDVNVVNNSPLDVNVVNNPNSLTGQYYCLVTDTHGTSFSLSNGVDRNLFTIRGVSTTKDLIIKRVRVTPISLSAAARVNFLFRRYTGSETGGTVKASAPLNINDGNAAAVVTLGASPTSGIISTPRASRLLVIGSTSSTPVTTYPPPETVSYDILEEPVVIPKNNLHAYVLQANANNDTSLLAHIDIFFQEL